MENQATYGGILRYLDAIPIPSSAIAVPVRTTQTAETLAASRILFDFVHDEARQSQLARFFDAVSVARKESGFVQSCRRLLVPERAPYGLRGFSFLTEEHGLFLPLICAAMKWGIDVPPSDPVLTKLRRVSIDSSALGVVVQAGGGDYSIKTRLDGSTLGGELHIVGKNVKKELVVLERRCLQLGFGTIQEPMETTGQIGVALFATEVLWYPIFGHDHVVKYLRHALQGAIGRVTDPLQLVQLMAKCEANAPRLREVLFAEPEKDPRS
ncbi:MAG: hypothetical protein Q8R39_04375 [bacterium]|nr:hypothetical protein [bacterium]